MIRVRLKHADTAITALHGRASSNSQGSRGLGRVVSAPPALRVATENMRFRVTAAAVTAARDGSMPGGATSAGAAAVLSAVLPPTALHQQGSNQGLGGCPQKQT